MSYRFLGRSGLAVAPLAFGGNVFGWTVDEATAFDLLDAFVDAGLNLIDTADVYPRWAPGCTGLESETVIGHWLARGGKRDKVLIATKCGKAAHNPGLSPKAVKRAVDEALTRLHTDVIDLFQAHAFDPDVPQAETLGAFAELIAAGKLRAIGCSNFTAAQLTDALATSARLGLPRYATLQPQYNLVERADYETQLAPVVAKETVGVLPYYALASGFLTGKYRTQADLAGHARGVGAGQYLDTRGLAVLAALDTVAARHRATPAQVALAWLMTRPGIAAPIASATSVAQLHELAKATELVLDADDLQMLDDAG